MNPKKTCWELWGLSSMNNNCFFWNPPLFHIVECFNIAFRYFSCWFKSNPQSLLKQGDLQVLCICWVVVNGCLVHQSTISPLMPAISWRVSFSTPPGWNLCEALMWQYGITLLQYLRSSELQAGWNGLKGVPGCKEPAAASLNKDNSPSKWWEFVGFDYKLVFLDGWFWRAFVVLFEACLPCFNDGSYKS